MKRSRSLTLALLLALSASTACDDGSADPSREDAGDELLDQGQSPVGAQPDAGTKRDAGRVDRLDGGLGGGGEVPDAARDAAVSPGADAAIPTSSDAVPAGDHCAPVASFDANATAFEEEVLKLTNEARAVGHTCDANGTFGATAPLVMQPQLRCAARLHSKYMAETGKFDHVEPDNGSSPGDRISAAGYRANGSSGENIAAGQRSPKEVVDGWLESDGHCANLMRSGYMFIGVGYVVGKPLGGRGQSSPYWTQNFAGSR